MVSKTMTASVYSLPSTFGSGKAREGDWPMHRLVVRNPDYAWSERVMSKLGELVNLPIGWDGYRGRGVEFSIAYFAANLLQNIYVPGAPCPSLVPGSDGSVQIEWHSHGLDIELDILGVNQVNCIKVEVASGEDEEANLTTDFKIVRGWVEDMAGRGSNAVNAAA